MKNNPIPLDLGLRTFKKFFINLRSRFDIEKFEETSWVLYKKIKEEG